MIFKKNQLLDNTPPPLIQRYTSMHKFIFTEILYQCDHLGLVEVYFLLVSKIKLKKKYFIVEQMSSIPVIAKLLIIRIDTVSI